MGCTLSAVRTEPDGQPLKGLRNWNEPRAETRAGRALTLARPFSCA
jgi:hypothetical protein